MHLTAGNSLSIGFDRLDACQPCIECREQEAAAYLVFGADSLSAGESMRLEMFENNLSEPPLTSVMAAAPSTWAVVGSGPGAWQDFQGIVRATMLSGEVDVSYAQFTVIPGFRVCNTIVAVPEPHFSVVATLSLAIVGAMRLFRRTR